MSYVNKKIRAFREAGDIEIHRKRSDGRMKTYQSATDARAWSDIAEERRQHILELIREGYGKGLSLGKYIPIEVIIDILLANKNADIERLQQRNKELEDFIKKNGVEKPAPAPEAKQTKQPEAKQTTKQPDSPRPTQAVKIEKPKPEAREAEKKIPEELTSKGASQAETDDKLRQADDTLGGKSEEEIGQQHISGQTNIEPSIKEPELLPESTGIDEGAERSAAVTLASAPVSTTPSLKEDALRSEEEKGKPSDGGTITPHTTDGSDDKKPSSEAEKSKDSAAEKSKDPVTEESKESAAEKSKEESLKKDPEDAENAAKELLAGKSPEEQQLALKGVLEERDKLYREQQSIAEESIEQLERIQDIVDEEDNKENRRKERAKVDPNDLRKRLDNLKGLEDEVKKLKGKALAAGDSTDVDKLKDKTALEKEIADLKGKLKEMDLCKWERDCLKTRVDDMSRIQKDYEDLLKKTQGFDALQAELAQCKAKCEELKNAEAENKELRAKLQKLDVLENERALLIREIENCECCMTNQEDDIKRLTCHIECLSQDLDKRQEQMKVTVTTMRIQLQKKDSVIAKSEQQLADVQSQLRNSIENLSCETSCLRNRIEELEDQAQKYEERALKLKMSLDAKEESNKALLEKLENEKDTSAKLAESLKNAIKNDEHLKQMLGKAKCAIKCITQKLDDHDIIESGKLQAERENYITKIKALEDELACERVKVKALEHERSKGMGQGDEINGADRIEHLEKELSKAKATIKCLRENLIALTE